MLRLAWRDVRLHPVRFIMSILAVLLGVAFVTGTFAMRTMLGNTFDKIVTTSIDGDVYIHANTGEIPDMALGEGSVGEVPIEMADVAQGVDSVAFARVNFSGAMVLVDKDGKAMRPVGSGGAGAPSSAMGVTDLRSEYSGYNIEGLAPQGYDQIVLEGATAERSGLAIGDVTTVVVGQEPRQVKVTGIFRPIEETPFAGALLIGISEEWAQSVFAPAGTIGAITVFAAQGYSPDQVRADLIEVLPNGVTASLASELQATAKDSIDQLLGFINAFLLVFAAIALFVGSFIIANTFSMVVRGRMRETAVIRAVGASPRQVFGSFVGQAAIIGLVGSALGLAGGFGLLQLIRKAFTAMDMPLSGAVPWSVVGVVVPVVLGVTTACLAAALPAWRASKVPPVDAMRDGVETQEKSLKVRTWVASGLALVGVCLIGLGLSQGTNGGLPLGIGALLLLAGLLGLAPVLAPGFTRVLAWPFALVFRPFGAMARRGVVRNPRRTANTAAALLIGTALVGATTVMVTSTSASIKDLIGNEMEADFMVQDLSYAPMTNTLIDQVEQIDGMQAFKFGGLPASVKDTDDNVYVAVAAADSLMVATDALVVAGSGDNIEGNVVLMNTFADQYGYQVGDQIELMLAPNTPFEAEVSTKVGAIIKSAMINMGPMITWNMLEAALPSEAIAQMVQVEQIAVVLDSGVGLEQGRELLEEATAPYLAITVMDQSQFGDEVTNQINQLLYIIYALLALSVIIAVLGIVNTLALSVMERTREIGLMRAVGLGRSQLALTTIIEGVLIALFGAVLGLALGTGLAATLPTILADIGLNTLVISWPTLAALVGVAGLVGVVAALWPAVRAARLPVLTAVSYE
ncbi:MAG: FtsX-like permease family protein [Micrococcales bacterium]|nr:FtsX-like permease family protein [Micrococcales bacterium]